MIRSRFLALAVATALMPCRTPAAAQDRPAPACSFDTASVSRPDSAVVGLAAAAIDLLPAKGPPEALKVAEAIALNFLPPSAMSLPLWARINSASGGGRPSSPEHSMIGRGLDEFFHITLKADGHLADTTFDIRSASPEFNAALAAAILRADSTGDLPIPGEVLLRGGGRITLRTIEMPKAGVPAYELMKVRLVALRADKNVRQISGASPRYPANARQADLPGDVVIQYVVGANGRVDPAARFHLLQTRYRVFAEAVVEALPGARFEPAEIGGCAVAIMAWQQFSFRMRPR